MKTKTLPLVVLATLLSTTSYGQTADATSSASTSISASKTDNQSIYNLYQLSQLLAGEQENERAIGYINHLHKISKSSEKDDLKLKINQHINYKHKKVLDDFFYDLLYFKAKDNRFSIYEDFECISEELKELNKLNKLNKLKEILKQDTKLKKVFKFLMENSIPSSSSSSSSIDSDYAIYTNIKNIRNLNRSLVSYKEQVKEVLAPINLKINGLKMQDSARYNALKPVNGLYLENIEVLKTNLEILDSLRDQSLVASINLENYRNHIYNQKKEFKDLGYGLPVNYENAFSNDALLTKDSIISFLKFTYHNYDKVKEIRNSNFTSLVNAIQKDIDYNSDDSNEFKFLTNSNPDISSSKLVPLFTLQTVEAKANPQGGFKMPSESDVIMGVAKFMANRAKQETMIWFIDKLRKDMRNSLIQDAFPKTLGLLEEQEDLAIPEFNETWQLALSEDFVKMPTNVINSNWVANKVGNEEQLNTLKSTVNISSHFFKLMNGKNDYRTILEQLYLQQQSLTTKLTKTSNQSLFDSLTFLYILSNEFYQVDTSGDKPLAQLLTLGDFERMSTKQWEIVLDLIRLKYGEKGYNSFKKIYDYIPEDEKNSVANPMPDLVRVNSKFTNVFNGFKALDKITTSEDYATKEKKAIALLDQVLVLLKHLDPGYNEITNSFSSNQYTQIAQFEQLLGVYKSIHQKEFGEAAKSTLNLVKPLVAIEEFELEIENNQLKLNNEKIAQLLRKKDKAGNATKMLSSFNSPLNINSSNKYVVAKKGDNIEVEVYSDVKLLESRILQAISESKKELKDLIIDSNSKIVNLNEVQLNALNETIIQSRKKVENALYDLTLFVENKNKLSVDVIINNEVKPAVSVEKLKDTNSLLIESSKFLNIDLEAFNSTPSVSKPTPSDASAKSKKNQDEGSNAKIKTEIYTINIDEFKKHFKDLSQLRDLNWKNLNASTAKDSYQFAENFAKKTLATSFIQRKYTFKDSADSIQTRDFVEQLFPGSVSENNGLSSLKKISYLLDLVDNPAQVSSNLIYDDLHSKELTKNLSMLNSSAQLLVKTTTFFTDILRSPDKDGVYRAIENAVAPPTSYLTKRKYSHTLSLNGYVGAYAGYQHVRSTLSDYKSSFTYGITAPIGFTYSTPKWGIFVQALDLGNLVGHYLWETNREFERQKVTVKEVFSPGMNFLYNIPDSPFVLFTGMKMIQVEERYDEEYGFINSGSLDLMQFTAGIKIDIPFFTIKKW